MATIDRTPPLQLSIDPEKLRAAFERMKKQVEKIGNCGGDPTWANRHERRKAKAKGRK